MIELKTNISQPLYEQLYRALAEEIRTGQRAAGSRLPGKRSMAAQLAVSVNTVDTAYQMLAAEGFLQSRPRSGFVVEDCSLLPGEAPLSGAGKTESRTAQGGTLRSGATPTEKVGTAASTESFRGACDPSHAPANAPRPPMRFDLSTGSVDTALFPFRTWGRLQKELLYASPELLRHGESQGDESLRAAIAAHLRLYRGVQCSPAQVVVGAGVEYLVGLAAQLLRGSHAAVENPGYHRAQVILQNNGVACTPVDIDGSGLRVDALAESGANLCYVTPSHHFPTGVTMPVARRAALLRWAAAQEGRYILEDDYDSEFRFDIRPLPSLQGMAGPGGPVIYLFTFSKSLAPGIRIACMVLPEGLLAAWQQMFSVYSCTVSRFEQQTLCRFLAEGHFARHLARMRLAYKQRMELLCAALEAEFPARALTVSGRHTGLHLVVSLAGGSEAEMVARAAAAGVKLAGLSEYYLQRAEACPPGTVILGYAALPDSDIPLLAKTLRQCWPG